MVLHIHSDASYFSEIKARTRVGGHYLLSDCSLQPNHPPETSSLINGPIYTVSTIMSNLMSSAAEADIGATFINLQESVPIQTTLAELGQPQPPTPICVYNSTAEGFAKDTIK